MGCVFLNFKALSKQAAEGNPIGITDRSCYLGASMLSAIWKEMPGAFNWSTQHHLI